MAAVLLFHGGFAWAQGGYLGVSTFFTLSGYLITRLLLGEQAATGATSLRRFWSRRVRRLGPASLITLLAVTVIGRTLVSANDAAGLDGDVLAALLQVANWRFVLEGRSYGDLFTAPSMVQHFWSLAIEEQLYLVVPLVVAGCGRLRNPRRALAVALSGLAVASVLATVLLGRGASADRIYYGTDTRAFELIAGAGLALLGSTRAAVDRPRGRAVQIAGGAALGLSAAAWATVAQDEAIVTRGGLWAYALLSVALIVGARAPGPLRRALSFPPVVQLGVISYGVYLFHWPLFQLLSPEALGVDRVVAFALATTLTVALAHISHTVLEQPVLTGRARWVGSGRRPVMVATSAFVVVALVATLTPSRPARLDLDRAEDDLAALLASPDVPPDLGAPVVSVVGDSTGLALALGVATWAGKTGDLDLRTGVTGLGCGLITEGTRVYNGVAGPIDPACRDRAAKLAKIAPDVNLVVFMAGVWEVAGYRTPGSEEVRTILDASLATEMAAILEDIYTATTAGGARFAFVIVPDLEGGVLREQSPAQALAESDPERIARYNQLGRDLQARYPDDVSLIDLRSFMAVLPGGALDRDLRPDGIHLTIDAATLVSSEFMGQAIIDAAGRRPPT